MTDLENIRAKALNEMDRAERGLKAAIYGAAIFEAFFLMACLVVADLRNQLHQLILFGIGLIYMPLVLGLIALGAFVNRCTLRVLTRLDELQVGAER